VIDLVSAFGNRCQTIGREWSLNAQENFEEALKMAEEKDKQLKVARSSGEELPPLFGIPFSVKD